MSEKSRVIIEYLISLRIKNDMPQIDFGAKVGLSKKEVIKLEEQFDCDLKIKDIQNYIKVFKSTVSIDLNENQILLKIG